MVEKIEAELNEKDNKLSEVELIVKQKDASLEEKIKMVEKIEEELS